MGIGTGDLGTWRTLEATFTLRRAAWGFGTWLLGDLEDFGLGWDLVTCALGGLWNGDFRTGVGTWGHEHSGGLGI